MHRTTDTDVSDFKIHLQVVVTWHRVINLITDSQAALRFAGTQCAESVKYVSIASQVSRILQHRLKSRLSLHTSTDLHPTVASTQHHDDVIAMATWLEVLSIAVLDNLSTCGIIGRLH